MDAREMRQHKGLPNRYRPKKRGKQSKARRERENKKITNDIQQKEQVPANKDNKRCAICRANRISHPSRKFFSFPKDPELSAKWVRACLGCRDLSGRTPDQLNVSCKVCSHHFSVWDYATAKRHRLTPTAVPSLNLDDSSSGPSSEPLTMNYRWCGVPECSNTSIKTPHKVFIHVPIKPHIRKKWLKAARRDASHLSPLSRMHFCEDHFDLENDMLNHMEMSMTGSVKRIRLREGCLPSKFDCQSGKIMGKTTFMGKTTPRRPRKKRKVTTKQQCDWILEEYEEKAQGSATLQGNENDGNQSKSSSKSEMDSESSSSDERSLQNQGSSSSQQETTPPPAIKTEPPTDDEPVSNPISVPESSSTQYVIKGKRFVNVGYLIRSLQKLNDHGGYDCNFSDMTICGETKEGWNIGVELSCKRCFTSVVVWMEDPDAKLVKTRPNLLQTATIPQTQPQMSTIPRTQSQISPAKVPLKKSKPHPRKTPTPPPDNSVRHFLVPLPLTRSVNLPLINTPQATPFIKQEVLRVPSTSHDTSSSMSNVPPSSSTKPAAVQLLFFVDQPASSQPVPTRFASTAKSSVENITVTPDIFVGSQKYSSTSLGTSSTSENITVTPDIYPADVLPVDLNLVKKEVEDEGESLGDGHQSMGVNDKPGVCLVPMSETSLDPSQKLFASDDPKLPTTTTEIPEASSSARGIKISSVTSCSKTSATRIRSETSTTLSETADSSVPTVSCTPTFTIVKKVLHEDKQGSKEDVFKRTAGGESNNKLSQNNSKRSKTDI